VTLSRAYRRPGTYRVVVEARNPRCVESLGENYGHLDVIVGEGQSASNGPQQVVADLYDNNSRGRHGHLTLIGTDADGYVSSISVDWGDGTPNDAIRFPLRDCIDPGWTWPLTQRRASLSHAYATALPHVVRVTAVSVGCDGHFRQENRTTVALPDRRNVSVGHALGSGESAGSR
jgi:hypothetical protein